MNTVNCIFACGEMRNFTAPMVWSNRGEGMEIVFNLTARICDACGAVAFIPKEARQVHDMLVKFV